MKKALIVAMAMTLVLTGSLFAAGRTLVAQPNATFTPGVGIGGSLVAASGPTTTNNDDSCDIGTAPAATLLLPYFAVNPTALNTIFTIVNTSNVPQIAHVTVWTDWSFPVLDFNVFLTGYDVQPLSLRDIIFNGVIGPTATSGVNGTTDAGGTFSGGANPSPRNATLTATTNPNFSFTPRNVSGVNTTCTNSPGGIGQVLTTAIQNALINGTYVIPGVIGGCTAADAVGSPASSAPGSLHPAGTAVGYVTIDVAANCNLRLPTDAAYFATDILFDNTLTGDWEIFDASQASNFAGGSPLVHIRAIPEGGPLSGGPARIPAAGTAATNLPYTFYGRYLVGNTQGLPVTADRRQPLPSTFAARFIQGGGLSTEMRIWREGLVAGQTTCTNAVGNSQISITEIVRFDEHENAAVFIAGGNVSPSTPAGIFLPETASVPVSSVATGGTGGVFPGQPGGAGDVGGWLYMNLDASAANNPSQSAPATINPLYPAAAYGGRRPTQNWVVVSLRASGPTAGAFAADFDATWLGNGCSPSATTSTANGGTVPIGPRPNVTP
jgi:hypothetical protein